MGIHPAILRRRGGGSRYGVFGAEPPFVAGFGAEYYRANLSRSTFADTLDHAATTNATMVDSDGLLKWRPHNLALNSATPATQSITVVSGADYTVECTGVSIVLSGAGTGTVTEGNPVEITASTTTLTLTVTGSTGTMWAYRSDLGGMVNNPDRGDSYVPTTSAAVYLPRRNHHVWDGSAWVNEGLLHESEARTNLIQRSIPTDATYWSVSALSATENVSGQIAPDGTETVTKLVESATTASRSLYKSFIVTGNHSCSVFVKSAGNGRLLRFQLGSSDNYFDPDTGLWGTTTTAVSNLQVENWGNGWYRVSLTYDGSAALDFFALGLAAVDGAPSYAGDGMSGLYVWGAQLEAGSTPSSYIPTTGATATRAAETLTAPSANLPWGDAVCIQMKGRMTYADEGVRDVVMPWRWYASSSIRMLSAIHTDGANTGRVEWQTYDSVNYDFVVSAGDAYSPGINVPFNIASRHGSTFINGAVDGTALTEDTTPVALPDLSSTDMQIGYNFMGTIKTLRIWATDLGDTGIEAAST